MIETSRRSLITGLVALVAAPAIVKASSLMQVKATSRLIEYNGLMTLDDFVQRILEPMTRALADQVAESVMTGSSISQIYQADRGGSGQVVQVTRTLPQQFRCIT